MMATSGIGYVCSLLFALIVVWVDWESLRGNDFRDTINYLNKIEAFYLYGFDYFFVGTSWLDYLKAEYLWHLSLYQISQYDLDPSVALSYITFFCSFFVHRFVSMYIGATLAFALLINPMVIQLLSEQIRSATAFSIFLVLMMSIQRRWLVLALYPVLLFIHSMMFGVLAAFALSSYISNRRKLNISQRSKIALIMGVVLGIGIATLVPSLLGFVGDRRDLTAVRVSSFEYMIFWLFWGIGLVIIGSKLRKKNRRISIEVYSGFSEVAEVGWVYYYSILMCVATPIMVLFGFPSYRFMAISIPIVLCSLAYLDKTSRSIGVWALLSYQLLLFSYWIK